MEPMKESLADKIQQRKRLAHLEQGLTEMVQFVKEQREALKQLQDTLNGVVREEEFKKGIGLAFTEFESRLQDALQETSRKHLQMFSRKEDLNDVQEMIKKKVNIVDQQALSKRITEIRTYVDAAAEQVFSGQKEILQTNFDRKADAVSVDLALKKKADSNELHDLRARLERLEMVFRHAGMYQSVQLDDLRAELKCQLEDSLTQMKPASATQGPETALVEVRDIDHVRTRAEQSMIAIEEVKMEVERSFQETLQRTVADFNQNLHEVSVRAKKQEQETRRLASLTEKLERLINIGSPLADARPSAIKDVTRYSLSESSSHERTQAQEHNHKTQKETVERLQSIEDAQEMHRRKLRDVIKAIAIKDEACVGNRTQLRSNITALERALHTLEDKFTKHVEDHADLVDMRLVALHGRRDQGVGHADRYNGLTPVEPGDERGLRPLPVLWGTKGSALVTPRASVLIHQKAKAEKG
eukprot:GEMP01025435.1.p1 GENE.GEMP01025435.1~~GEMP01025435.1.p1  ORF type:complete len:472 (+),score=135.50 GEMP01025435.1:58-1473(+)